MAAPLCRRLGPALGLALAWAQAAPAAAAESLKDAVQQALATNPRIGAVTSNRNAVDEELRQARGLYLPQVDLTVGYGREHSNDLGARRRLGAGIDAGGINLYREEATLNATQRLFDGFEAASEVERQKSRAVSAARRVVETSQFLALDAVEAYLGVVRQRDLYRLAEQNVRVHADTLQSLRRRLEGGGGSSADVAQTEARLARSRATLTQVLNDLRDSEAIYQRNIGKAPGTLARPTLAAGAVASSLEAAVDLTTRNNPTAAIFEADVKVSESDIDLANSRFYPRFNIEAQGSYYDSRDGIATWEREGQVMLRARWNLYRGGADLGNRREALARRAEALNRRHNAQLEAQEQARRAWNAVQAAREQVGYLNDAVRFSVQTLAAYRQQFGVGHRSLLDVLDAENELFVARSQLVSADINTQLASYRLLAVSGALLDALEIKAPAQANPENRSFLRDLIR